jgi:hypothetical protein
MPKRLADEHGGGCSAKLPTRQRKHLYLVLDDWELGYSIRKVDLPSDFDSDEADHERGDTVHGVCRLKVLATSTVTWMPG